MTPLLQIERWPDRKRKVLSAVDGNVSTVLATFQNDAAAATFLKTINDKLVDAYLKGQQSVLLGLHNQQQEI